MSVVPFFCPECGADLDTLEPRSVGGRPGWHCPICDAVFDIHHRDAWQVFVVCRQIEEARA